MGQDYKYKVEDKDLGGAMAFILLSQDEQDEIHAAFLASQERDLFCHQINAERYAEMLKTLPAGTFRTRIEGLKQDTLSRIDEVTRIIDASAALLPSVEKLIAAKERVDTKVLATKLGG
jgi:hypothetical protein